MTTPQILDERFRDSVSALTGPETPRTPDEPLRDGTALTGARAQQLFDAQLTSRHLDLAARWLRSFDEGFHTVGSSGHEGNAAVAAAVRATDPALLHYRSAAFYCVRAADGDPVGDILRGVVASAQEPHSGGRQKVFGRADRAIIPTTSMNGAHLPRAVGLAVARSLVAAGVRVPPEHDAHQPDWPDDAIVLASFGDAAINHSAATAAFQAAGWYAHTGRPLPLLLICEDNGWGGSVAAPQGWVAATLQSRPGLTYVAADGSDLAATYDAATKAAAHVRSTRRPAVLHLSMVRLMGHAGTEEDTPYRTVEQLARDLDRDPVVGTARLLVEAGLAEPEELITRYDEVGWQVRKVAEEILAEPKLAAAADVLVPLAPRRPTRSARTVADAGQAAAEQATDRTRTFGGQLPEEAGPLTLAQTINATLTDALLAEPGALVFGPDVASTGGAYGVTKDLGERFGGERVFDTVLDATTVLGLALGAGAGGLLPVPEIPHLAYLHSAQEQLRGEAAMLSYLSAGAYRNPMVLRVPGLADPASLDGHVPHDNAVAGLRDVPGLVLAVPARPADAAPMLRSCLASASADGSVCVFLEPIALYHARDLHEPGDDEWLAPYLGPADWAAAHLPIGRAGTYPIGSAEDLTILTFGSGLRMSLRVAARLTQQGYGSRVVDLRWLNPLPVADLIRESAATGRVLIVDESRRSGGFGEGILAALVDGGFVGAARRIAAVDAPVPLGPAARHVLIGEDAITQGAYALLAR